MSSNVPADPFICTSIARPFRYSITPPGSKSLTNRALLLAALTDGASTIVNPLRADDTEVMVNALHALLGPDRILIKENEQGGWDAIKINGVGGKFTLENECTLNLENAGTATRFLTAACCLADKPVTIDGNTRMRQRPIGELVDLLKSMGANIDYLERDGFVPLRISPSKLKGGRIEIGETLSSQYISALLQIGTFCEEGLTLEFTGRVRSASYIVMTLGLLERFGAKFKVKEALQGVQMFADELEPCEYVVEPDASSATYFLGAAAVCPGAVTTIEKLGHPSLQGDAAFANVLRIMGAGLTFGRDFVSLIGPRMEGAADDSFEQPDLRGHDFDMNTMPDAAMTLAVVALFARGETVIRGVGNLRYKETDRLAALQTELSKFGADVEIEDDEILIIQPPEWNALVNNTTPITIETYDDHRMAMAFAVAGVRVPNVRIADPMCVCKTYPEFWRDWCAMLNS